MNRECLYPNTTGHSHPSQSIETNLSAHKQTYAGFQDESKQNTRPLKNSFLFLLTFVGFLFPFISQAQIEVGAEIRPRTEFRNGYQDPVGTDGISPEFVTTQRSRLFVGYENNKITGKISFQDVRTWGESTTKSDAATLHLHEAWFEFPLIDSLRLQMGRIEISYDNERLLATTNWHNVGSQHDLAIFKYETKKMQGHIGLAYNNQVGGALEESNYPIPYYKALGYLWLKYNLNKQLNFSIIAIDEANPVATHDTKYYNRLTAGANIWANPIDNLKVNIEGYVQLGKNKAGKSVEAYMFNFRADYKVMDMLTPFAGIDMYSGNDPNNPTRKTAQFDRLYGAKHKYYGYMDYFPSVQNGLIDNYIGANIKPLKKTSVEVALHGFMLPGRHIDPSAPSENLKNTLGAELDIKVGYKIAPDLSVMGLFGMLKGTKTMDVVKGGDHKELNNYVAVMLTYKPKFRGQTIPEMKKQ